ncbi:MAG: nucleotidyl transferase AbiEii/AbiGii toxin family protein [Pseudoclavibacter sp.]
MTADERYASPSAVEAAIAAAARRASAADPSLTAQERIRLEYFHRFLSRIFSAAGDSNWVLKGGTSMLARVASARATTDIDLYRRSQSLDAALADLRRLASIDLGDFFRFEYTGFTDAITGNQQTYIEGYQVDFDVYIGAKRKDHFHVDLVVNVVLAGEVEIVQPANTLDLSKLPSSPYRLYPVADQIADKVCATLARYSGGFSTREKDLVDLVVLVVTQDIVGENLRKALGREFRTRFLPVPSTFGVPPTWGRRYRTIAAQVPACRPYLDIESAVAFVRSFISPVFDGSAEEKRWDHSRLEWC